MSNDVLVVTTNDVPGYEVVEVYGEVFGLIVRSRNVFSNIGASLRTVVGCEAAGWSGRLDSTGSGNRGLRVGGGTRGLRVHSGLEAHEQAEEREPLVLGHRDE